MLDRPARQAPHEETEKSRMKAPEMTFAIPTYRLRDVADTIEKYDENFSRNGHALSIVVFDDSSLANHEKYFPLLEQTKTVNELQYVGPREKEQFIAFLCKKVRNSAFEPVVRNLFRPSYGGNRNFALMYTLGELLISSDDDMRPEALIESSPESLGENEVCRGKLTKATDNGYVRKSFDLLTSFRDVLGLPVRSAPANYETGELLTDTSMDLETNTSTSFSRENSLMLTNGSVPRNAVVKIAQTYRTGTNDIDAIDYAQMFLQDEQCKNAETLTDVYVLVNFRPVVTKRNWRIDCGVAGYDNRLGLPPFFPTRLRFEDYIYRIWIQQPGLASAHVDAVQTHLKNNYMRNPLAAEVFNEELCFLLKRKIHRSITRVDDLSIKFDCATEVNVQESDEILEKVTALHGQVAQAAAATPDEERKHALNCFAENLSRAFYGFEPDFFQQNVSRIVDDVLSQIQASLELWPTLIEICYYHKDKKDFPRVIVENKRLKAKPQATL
jgi:hypothetical protein